MQQTTDLRKRNRQIIATFGARMAAARELCGMRQADAARVFGYANSSGLAKVELGREDTQTIPPWLIEAASCLYDVSADFLFGLIDDFDRDIQSRNSAYLHRWLLEQRVQQSAQELAEIQRIARRLSILERTVESLSCSVDEILTAVLTFWTRNPNFQDMPAGAPVVSALERADLSARKARVALGRFPRSELRDSPCYFPPHEIITTP